MEVLKHYFIPVWVCISFWHLIDMVKIEYLSSNQQCCFSSPKTLFHVWASSEPAVLVFMFWPSAWFNFQDLNLLVYTGRQILHHQRVHCFVSRLAFENWTMFNVREKPHLTSQNKEKSGKKERKLSHYWFNFMVFEKPLKFTGGWKT